MAVIVAGTVLAQIVGQLTPPLDVEADTSSAVFGTLNVHLTSGAGQPQVLPVTIAIPVTATILATLVAGPCSVTISQGVGTLSGVTVSQ